MQSRQNSETPAVEIDPWLGELSNQCASNDFADAILQHKINVQTASEDFSSAEHSSKHQFLNIIADGLSQVRRQYANGQAALQRAQVSLEGIDCLSEEEHRWLWSAAGTAMSEVQSKMTTAQRSSSNALHSENAACNGMVDRPGPKNLLWKKQYAVVTKTGFMHLFDSSAATFVESDALPRLRSLPCSSLALRDCTVSVVDHCPSSLKIEVVEHSKMLPATRYTLKLEKEEDVVDWTVALKDNVPKDSVWMERVQRNEDVKNTKFIEKRRRGGC